MVTKTVKTPASKHGSPRLSRFLAHKPLFLVIFAIVYGLVFINYIDVITNGSTKDGYHLWLVLMYFLPFAILSVIDFKNWRLTLGLGFLTSIMNDVFYGLIRNIMGAPYDLERYYSNWLVPGNAVLFNLNLGFTVIPVESWMMAFSIYIRLAVIFLFLDGWKYIQAFKQKPNVVYEPEVIVSAPHAIEVEEPL